MFRFIAAVASVAIFAALASAQNCRTANCNVPLVQQAYVAPVYAQQHVVYDQNVILVPKAFAVNVAPVGAYLGIADSYRDAHFARQVAEELFKLNQQFAPQPQAAPGGTAQPLAAPKKLSAIAKALGSNCVSCHMPGKKYPDLSGDPELMTETVRLKVFHRVGTETMPPKNEATGEKTTIPQVDYNAIGEWAFKKPTESTKPSDAPKAAEAPKEPAKLPKAPDLGPAPAVIDPKDKK